MKERPILFSGPMVRAILEGRKTQTRRIAKLTTTGRVMAVGSHKNWHPDDPNAALACPYGQPGDRLWVKETWQYADWTDDGYPFIRYAADNQSKLFETRIPDAWEQKLEDAWCRLSTDDNYAIDGKAADRVWRPSIFMPRFVSRISLEVTAVRVQRLQDISPADCRAEGMPVENNDAGVRYGYGQLWNQLNEKRGFGWAANPWVWVIEFRMGRVTP